MKAVVGVDLEYYPLAIELYNALACTDAETHLVHVVSSVLPDQSLPELGPEHPITQIQKAREEEGRRELEKASASLSRLPVSKEIRFGDPARVLIEFSEEMGADLVVIGSAQKSRWTQLFEGSVSNAVSAGAKQSILVAKRHVTPEDGMHAIFATDHSDYNYRCLDELLRLKPMGLDRITVLSATRLEESIREPLVKDMPDVVDTVLESIISEIERKNLEVCRKCEQMGIPADTMFIQNDPTAAIEEAMKKTGADLLILGAQGRNFWERLRLGSVSHHAVVATPHNVLIVRV